MFPYLPRHQQKQGRSRLDNGRGRSNKGHRCCNDLITRAYAQCRQREVQCGRVQLDKRNTVSIPKAINKRRSNWATVEPVVKLGLGVRL